MEKCRSRFATLAIAVLSASASHASEVKITPVGNYDREFGARDRVLIFQDYNANRYIHPGY